MTKDSFHFVCQVVPPFGMVTKVFRNGQEIERIRSCQVTQAVNGKYSIELIFEADEVTQEYVE